MASISGLQNNPTNNLNTIDGLQIINATAIYDNGVLIDTTNLVPYTGSTQTIDAGAQAIKTTYVPVASNDVVNLTTLQNAVAYVNGIASLNFVPFTGATSNTNLGTYGLSAGNITANSSLTVNGTTTLVGNITASSNLNVSGLTTLVRGQSSFVPTTGIDLTNKTYVDTADALRVPYTGATTLLNLGSNSLTASTAKFTTITSATPSLALGVDALGNLNTFAVPTSVNLLPLNNTWTGTNTFNNNLTLGDGYNATLAEVGYLGQNYITSATPTTTGITAIAPTPTGTITFSSPTYTMTPSGASTFASFWSSATFTGTTRCFFNFTNMSLANAPGSATITVCQANTGNTAYVAISSAIAIPQSAPIFSGYFAPNTNASYLGQVFFILSNVKFNPFSWTAFTYGYGSWTVQGNETVVGTETVYGTVAINNGVAPPATGSLGGSGDRLILYPGTSGTYPYSMGIDSYTFWCSAPALSSYKWHVNGTAVMTMDGNGRLAITNSTTTSTNTYIDLINTYAGGGGQSWRIGVGSYDSTSGTNFFLYDMLTTNVRLMVSTTGLFMFRTTNASGTNNAIATWISTATNSTLSFYQQVSAGAYNNICQAGDFLMCNLDNQNGVSSTAGTVIAGWNRNAGLRVGTDTVQVNGTFRPTGDITMSINQSLYLYYYGTANYANISADSAGNMNFNTGTAGVVNRLQLASNGAISVNGGTYFNASVYLNSIPQQTNIYSYPLVLCDGNQVCRSQSLQRYVQMANGLAWGGGSNYTYAFYKYNTLVPAKISGKFSYYVGSVGFAYPYMRIYSQNSGVYRTYTFPAYTNNTYNHLTFPFEYVFLNSDLPEQGWFDIYFYNGSGCITDTGDQLWINITLLPGSNY